MAGEPRRGDAWTGTGTGWAVVSILSGGILVWGALGYLADRLIGLEKVFTGIGIVLGAAGGIYLVYLRYGRGNDGHQ